MFEVNTNLFIYYAMVEFLVTYLTIPAHASISETDPT